MAALRVLSVLVVVCVFLSACGDADQATATSLQRSQRTFIDSTRGTPRKPGFAGADSRTLPVLLWTPPTLQPSPLVVLAHGFGGSPQKFEAFASALATAGYVVAAPTFPLTNEDAPGGHETGLGDLRNQPGDVSFVISELLAANAAPGDVLHGRIDAAAIAVLGHSLGAVTTIALTRKSCCSDARVRAAILVAPLPALVDFGFGGGPTAVDGPPTLFIHGTADPTAAYDASLQFYGTLHAPRFFVGLTGAGHSESVESQSEPPIAARADAQLATLAFLKSVFSGNRAGLTTALSTLATRGDHVEYEL